MFNYYFLITWTVPWECYLDHQEKKTSWGWMAFCSSPAAALYNIRKHSCSLNRAKVKCTHGPVPFAEAVAVCALFRVTLEKFSNRRRLQLCLDQIWRKMGRKKKSPPLVNIFHISHFVFLAGLETTCYWPGWISLRGLSKWNLNTGTIVCVRVCIFFFLWKETSWWLFQIAGLKTFGLLEFVAYFCRGERRRAGIIYVV